MPVKLENDDKSSIEATQREVVIIKKRVARKKINWAAQEGQSTGLARALFQTTMEKLRDFEKFVTPYDSISSLNIYEGGFLSSPYIQIVRFGDETISNARDADAIPYGLKIDKSKIAQLRQLRDYVEDQLREPSPVLTGTDAQASLIGIADEIRKLTELRDIGVITDAEFEAQKRKLMGATSPPPPPPPNVSAQLQRVEELPSYITMNGHEVRIYPNRCELYIYGDLKTFNSLDDVKRYFGKS